MLIRKNHKTTAAFCIALLLYALAVYPVSKEIQTDRLEKHSEHLQNCSCGCGGIEGRCCCCTAASGMAGFRNCSSSNLNTILSITSLWNIICVTQKPVHVSHPENSLPLLSAQIPHLQDVFTLIDHPPPRLS
jgi:hypothetical protein